MGGFFSCHETVSWNHLMALLPGDDGPYVFASKVPPLYDGFCLIDYFAQRFAYQDRSTWQARIAAGDLLVEGTPERDSGRILSKGVLVEYVHGEFVEPDVPTDWKVVSISRDWMAVSKPSGMPMHATPRIFRQTLTWQVRKMFGDDWSPAHRLDRETSGLVLFARGASMASTLGGFFARREVAKDYVALVHGHIDQEVDFDGAIGPAGDPEISVRQAVVVGGKEAQTAIRPIGVDSRGRGTWIVASPHQGRMHQIRVHCEAMGHPILGDPLYDGCGGIGYKARARGESREEWTVLVGGEALHLHAWRLHLPDRRPSNLPKELVCPIREGWSVPF
jgi:23S rRNA pseudouridine1911/1915/1917 synthase